MHARVLCDVLSPTLCDYGALLAGAVNLGEEAVYCTERLVFGARCIAGLSKVSMLDYWTCEYTTVSHGSIRFINFNGFNLKFVNSKKVCCSGSKGRFRSSPSGSLK